MTWLSGEGADDNGLCSSALIGSFYTKFQEFYVCEFI